MQGELGEKTKTHPHPRWRASEKRRPNCIFFHRLWTFFARLNQLLSRLLAKALRRQFSITAHLQLLKTPTERRQDV